MKRINAVATVGMLTHLANIMHSEGRVCGLSSAQSEALRYFAHANRPSRTVSAFAEFHATTRGTASQTIKSLVERGLLVRRKSNADGQRAHLDVTREGRSLRDGYDGVDLVRLIADLPASRQVALAEVLTGILQTIADERERHTFGPCSLCEYFKPGGSPESLDADGFCKYTRTSLPASGTAEICMRFKPDLSRKS